MSTGYTLPAEWAPQSFVLLTWPHQGGDWGNQFDEVEANFIELAKAISNYESVSISCADADIARCTEQKLSSADADLSKISINTVASNDVWARDHGPITVTNGNQARLLNFHFTGWGGKYESSLDNKLSRQLHAQGLFGSCPMSDIDCVLEGGAIETDGTGVMLTTTDCLPLPSRNPHWDLHRFETLFSEHFGIHTTHWLHHGHLVGDDTDGHIDTIARFTDPQTIVFQGCDDPDDEHFSELASMQQELTALKRADGEPYRLFALPLPAPIYEEGHRLPASYANFLIINNAVLMPGYNDPADKAAAEILAGLFPSRKIITIDCRALIRQYGSLHCVTMQLPAQVPHAKA